MKKIWNRRKSFSYSMVTATNHENQTDERENMNFTHIDIKNRVLSSFGHDIASASGVKGKD